MSLSDTLSNLLQASNRRIAEAIEESKKEQQQKKGGGKSQKSIKDLEKQWKAEMKNFDELIEHDINIGDYESLFDHYSQAQAYADKVAKAYRSRGYGENSTEVLSWLNKGFDYSAAAEKEYEKLFGGLTDSIEDLIDSLNSASAIQEKTLALKEAEYDLVSAREAAEKAGKGLENVKNQRNVRVWNEETDSWDYVADAAAVSSAEELLKKREEELRKAETALIKAENALSKLTLTTQLETFSASSGTVLGTELANLIASALQNLPQSAGTAQNVNYYLQNGIKIGSDEAQTTTLADLAKLLADLEIY